MAEMGSKPMGGMGTLMDESQPDQVDYPTLYLDDGDTLAVPMDMEVGETRAMKAQVRLASKSFRADGSRSVTLEIIEATVEESDDGGAAATGRMYPSMSRKE